MSEKETRELLRILLPKPTRIGHDSDILKYLLASSPEEIDEKIEQSEYLRRIFNMDRYPWQGLSWILDLLPDHPKDAIKILSSYYLAHCQFMTDHQLFAVEDCTDIIRAKYFDIEHPRNVLLQIDPIEFEWLVEELFKKMGYLTELTKVSYDGGIDLVAQKASVGKKEKLLIQCKRYENNIGVKYVRELNGVVSDKKATKGMLVTTSGFSREAKTFSDNNPRIELIDYRKLNQLLNIHISPYWPVKMDRVFRQKKVRKLNKTNSR